MYQPKSSSLTQSQLNSLIFNLKGKQTIICSSIAKIHTKELNEYDFTYTGLFGALTYLIDRESKKRFIKLFELVTHQVLFQIEVKPPFIKAYTKMNDHFSFFHYKNSTVGFSFAEYEDAFNFQFTIKQYTRDNSANVGLKFAGKFSHPMVFEMKENVRWDQKLDRMDTKSCSKKLMDEIKRYGVDLKNDHDNKMEEIIQKTIDHFTQDPEGFTERQNTKRKSKKFGKLFMTNEDLRRKTKRSIKAKIRNYIKQKTSQRQSSSRMNTKRADDEVQSESSEEWSID